MADINKAMAVIIEDRKVLVSRSAGKDFFIGPGGKLEAGETPEQALVRELHEELQITVREGDLEKLDTFEAPAAGDESRIVAAHVFIVHTWEGDISPANEIAEIRWIGSTAPSDMVLGSIFEHEVLPILKKRNLID